MRIPFTKMHGLGNDFVVIDGTRERITLDPDRIRALSDRRFGIGCDQVLLVEPAPGPEADFLYRIFNADGTEVEQCGNGARCFARFVRRQGLTDKDEIRVDTKAGPITLYVAGDDHIRVDMGPPEFSPQLIPFLADTEALQYALDVTGETLTIGALSMGNPHAIVQVGDLAAAPVDRLGREIETHPRFPQRANVGFMQIKDRGRIDLRVFERGAGETLACGSGACAAVVYGGRLGLLDERVEVRLPGGSLVISWAGPGEAVWMTGPATVVFDGTIDL